jgi:hypothetical protein
LPSRLIGEQDRGVPHDGPSDRQAAAFPDAEFHRHDIPLSLEAHSPQRRHTNIGKGIAVFAYVERDRNILKYRESLEQPQSLKYKADVPTPEDGSLGYRQQPDSYSIDKNLATVRPEEASQHVEQGCLTRAAASAEKSQPSAFYQYGRISNGKYTVFGCLVT